MTKPRQGRHIRAVAKMSLLTELGNLRDRFLQRCRAYGAGKDIPKGLCHSARRYRMKSGYLLASLQSDYLPSRKRMAFKSDSGLQNW
jgi:hypothetical protein